MSDPLEPWESALTGERYVIEGRWTYHHPYIVDDLRPDIKKTRQTIEQYLKLKIKELEKENEDLKEAFHKIIGELTSTIPDWSTSREICDSVNYDLDAFDWKEQS